MGYSTPTDTSTTQPYTEAQNTVEKPGEQKPAVRERLYVTGSWTHEIQWYGCLNKSCKMTPPGNMPTWLGGVSEGLPLNEEEQAVNDC